MRGEFRNGVFVDEDAPPEQRNIQYDLDPEKMEKIWVRRNFFMIDMMMESDRISFQKRYKSRWDRLDEIEKEKNLEERKVKFRARMEEKRQRMLNNQMSKEEREEFMFRIRSENMDRAFSRFVCKCGNMF